MIRVVIVLFVATLIGFADNATAQSRSFGAQQLILDNGTEGKLTIVYNGVGDATLVLGNGGLLPYATSGQTLRHNGERLDSSSTLFNTGTQVHTRGGLVHAIRTVTSSTTLTEGDHIVLVPWSECAQVDITLPAPSAGRMIVVRMIDNCQDCGECQGGVTVMPNNGEMIDQWNGGYWLAPWSNAVTLVSDGTDWYSIGSTFGGF